MTVPISVTVVVGLLCTAIGYLVATFLRRLPVSGAVRHDDGDEIHSTESPELSLIPELVQQLHTLTAQVGTQVNEHSARVGEITKTITASDEREVLASSIVLAASHLLITANQKLQSDLEEAKKEIQLQQEQLDDCLRDSLTDALTSLPNRRALDQKLQTLLALAKRYPTPFSLVMIDIDYFKRINDSYGHMVGDQLLKSISQRLIASLRESDFVARYGGEEFVGILRYAQLEEASETSERIRCELSCEPYKIGELELPVTASVGIKEFRRGETAEDLIERADQALYAAKHGGRNCSYYCDGQGFQRVLRRTDALATEVDSRSHRIEFAHDSIPDNCSIATNEATDSHLTF